jgi:hypothetical protein
MELYNNQIIWTPFYTKDELYVLQDIYINDEKVNNVEYLLYCIKSWIHYYLIDKYKFNNEKIKVSIIKHGTDEYTPIENEMIDIEPLSFFEEADINYEFRDRNNKVYLTLNFYYNGNKTVLDDGINTDIINYINTNYPYFKYYILLSPSDNIYTNDSDIIPNKWIYSILKFLDYTLPWKLTEVGLLLDISNKVDHVDIIKNLTSNIITLLRKMYKKGYIVNPDENFINNWGLIPKGKDGLYKVEYIDERLNVKNASEFLLSRLDGINYIDIRFTDNYLLKYNFVLNINKYLPNMKYIMLNDKLRIYVDNIKDISEIYDIYEDIMNTTYDDTKLDVKLLYEGDELEVEDKSVLIPIDDNDVKYIYIKIAE